MGPEWCQLATTGPTLSPADLSPLGFSANEIVELVATTAEIVPVRSLSHDSDPPSLPARTLSFVFVPEPEVRVETWTLEPGATADDCITGERLVIPGLLAVDAPDGWFSGIGPAVVTARAATADEVWVEAEFDVDASEALRAEASVHDPTCTGLRVSFRQSARTDAPWANGPAGALASEDCPRGFDLYRWGEVAP
ncbi:MAG: hypothetical protein R3F59_07235 [Myxococcota bacterium]